jgi:hypothetical protein
LPLSQQAGPPQQVLTVAAEADKDKSMTAANVNDRTLIFIKSPLGFQNKKDERPSLKVPRSANREEKSL